MGRVLTNATSVAYARQQAFDVLGGSPAWKTLEPNGITKATPDLTKVSRNPISKDRQRRKGSTVGVDSGFEYDADLTLDSWTDWAEGFCFVTATNSDLLFRAAPATATEYTIPATNAAQAAKLQWVTAGPKSLVFGKGYLLTANNGLKVLTADTGLAATTITVAGLSAETPPTNAELVIAGVRATAGDLAIVVSTGIATLTSGNNGITGGNRVDFTTLGLTVGQFIHIGGIVVGQQFSAGAGYARLKTLGQFSATFDKLSATLATDPGTAESVDLLFGRFIRNVPVDHADFLEQYFELELGFENLYETDPPTGVPEPNGFVYSLNNLPNVLSWVMALRDKATMTATLVGTDTEPPVDDGDRKVNAATPRAPLHTAAFNTSTDFLRLRITDVDEDGLTTDFKDITLSIDNGVTPELVLGRQGARFLNFGNFLVGIETSVLFTSPEVPERIRNSVTVAMDWIVSNDDGVIVSEIPSMDLGNGGLELPINETVRIALTGEAFKDPVLGYSFSSSLIPIVP